MQSKYFVLIICFIITVGLFSCSKSDFLNAKPNINLNVPSTLSDFQSLMDNYDVINQEPGMGDMSSDNYFYSNDDWQAQDLIPRNCYVWTKDIFEGSGNNFDWDLPYQQILVANVVLEGLGKINTASVDMNTFNTIKGEALFIRANAFFNLAQLFAPPFDSTTAKIDLGIPIRLSSDVSKIVSRSTVDETYAQILSDLVNARSLIGSSIPGSNINRPAKASVFALLSRVYLSMLAYRQAGENADSSLQQYSTLIDFNTLSLTTRIPFSRLNAETTFQAYQIKMYPLTGAFGVAQIDSTLYQSYDDNDLRKKIFFRTNGLGYVVLKGTYSGSYYLFSGTATNEMYLNRAECAARTGNIDRAMSDLNTLLSMRYLAGTYTPKTAATTAEALTTILTERRKELPFSNLRWTDLRRLNKENANITVTRMLNGQGYSLAPNSSLYVLPIPPDEISASSIEQNSR